DEAPAASNIPRAAASARGAAYAPPAAPVASPATETGVASCDAYVAAVKRCAKTMPPEAVKTMEDAAEQMRNAVASAPPGSRQVFEDGCRQALEAIDKACP